MGIGAIGSAVATTYNPYIYNTNSVSSASLNKINAIPDDATKGGADFTGVIKENENINPLKPGQTSNFADILMSQMSMSAVRQADLLATNPTVAASADTASDTATQTIV